MSFNIGKFSDSLHTHRGIFILKSPPLAEPQSDLHLFSPCLSPVSTQILMPARARLAMASGTPSWSLSSMAVAPSNTKSVSISSYTSSNLSSRSSSDILKWKSETSELASRFYISFFFFFFFFALLVTSRHFFKIFASRFPCLRYQMTIGSKH